MPDLSANRLRLQYLGKKCVLLILAINLELLYLDILVPSIRITKKWVD